MSKNQLSLEQLNKIKTLLKNHNCKCNLTDTNHFTVSIRYDPDLVEIFKSISNKRYDPKQKSWTFPSSQFNDLIEKLNKRTTQTTKTIINTNSNSIQSLFVSQIIQTGFIEFNLINRNQFRIETDIKNNSEFNQIIQSFNSNLSLVFSLVHYEDLVSKLKINFSKIIKPFNKVIQQVFAKKLSNNLNQLVIDMKYVEDNIDSLLFKSLYPFQIESVKFAIENNGRVILADDMGLGKTIQALAIASYYKSDWPLLIITPSSVKHMWKENILKWLPNTLNNDSNLIQLIEKKNQNLNLDSKVFIISYDLISNKLNELTRFNFKIIIADESHFLKSREALRTNACMTIVKQAKRVILISGTPALSRPSELFTQIDMVSPGLFDNFFQYAIRYCNAHQTQFGWDFTGASNLDELRAIFEEKILIRHEKSLVLNQLNIKKERKLVYLTNLVKSKELVEALDKVKKMKNGFQERRGVLMECFNETSKVKEVAVCEHVTRLLNLGKKLLVFAHHIDMLNRLEKVMIEKQFKYIRIDGSTKSSKRHDQVNQFQTNDSFDCALFSITAAGTSINLTKANMVVFAELFWNPGSLVQAEDRIFRIGQTSSVEVEYLLANETSDDILWPMLNKKLQVLTQIGLNSEDLDLESTQIGLQEINMLSQYQIDNEIETN